MPIEKVHEDKRGAILTFIMGGVEYTILTTFKGYARGGCIHNATEHAVVLSGSVEYRVKKDGEQFSILEKGETVTIPPETPHYLVALTDAITMEWGAPEDQKKRKDPEWRKIVDNINERKSNAGN